MKGEVALFISVCLSLAGGAPTSEESKLISKTYNFGDKEIIYSLVPFWQDEMVYAVCDGSDADKKCQVYVESADQDKYTARSCDLNLTYSGSFDRSVKLYNTGNSKAVFAVQGDDDKATLISVNFDGCEIKVASIDVPKAMENPVPFYTTAVIIPHDSNNNYDVLFHNKKLCQRFICKATFDYKGNVVKAVSTFPLRDVNFNFYNIKYVNGAYLVSVLKEGSSNVYLIHDEDTEPHGLYNGTGIVLAASTEENKLGYCVYKDNAKLLCRKYDDEYKITEIEVDVPIGKGRLVFLNLIILEKGLLMLSVFDRNLDNNNAREIFVRHYDEQGNQRKHANVDLKCKEPKILFPTLYKDSDGKFCVSSMCMYAVDRSDYGNQFSRNTRCFHEDELF